jgi:hypothetical protein
MGCRKMGAVTYPDAAVQAFLADHVEPVELDLTSKDPSVVAAQRDYRLLWAPGFVVLDPRGQEMRRWIGYLPPRDFLAEIRLALGKIALMARRFDDAHAHFRAVADLEPPAPVSDEGAYWAPIALYRRDGRDLEFLHEAWAGLRDRFPGSRWWTAADVFPAEPA